MRILFCWLLAATPALAFTSGPEASVGFVVTPVVSRTTTVVTSSGTSSASLQLGSLAGPTAQLGYEIGDHFTNLFTFQFTSASGPVSGTGGGVNVYGSANVQIYGGGYQLTYELFGKRGWHGLSPYLGGGIVAGTVLITEPLQASGGGQTLSATGTGQGPYLELHATAGARYTFDNGFGLKADVSYSTFGGFFGTFIPSLWVCYRLT